MTKKKNEIFECIDMGVCPECGAELIEFISKTSRGLQCSKCDWGVVRSWSPLDDYPYRYDVKISKPAQMDAAKYKAFSKISGLNYLQLKEAPVGEEFSERYNIYDTWKMIEFLNECGVEHVEEPEFPFSSKEEMKEKLMLDDF